jgi:hypothetical protein
MLITGSDLEFKSNTSLPLRYIDKNPILSPFIPLIASAGPPIRGIVRPA